jgi:branched-subunit amino acid aminotransferase/4-amino-4-deoxychorismate lyase
MNECFGKRFILNGKLEDAHSFDNSLVYEGDSVYEVIRMVRNNPVFFHDHMERLESSVKNQRKDMAAGVDTIRKDIIKLTKADRKKEVNLKIVFNYNKDSVNYLIYYIEPIYPSEKQYREGVKGILFYAERKDPDQKSSIISSDHLFFIN